MRNKQALLPIKLCLLWLTNIAVGLTEVWLLTMSNQTQRLEESLQYAFSGFLPPCLISLNSPVSYVHVNTVCEMSFPAGFQLRGRLLPERNLIPAPLFIFFSSLIIENHAFHPFFLTRRSGGVSVLIDNGNMYRCAPVSCCLNCVAKRAHEREFAILSAPTGAALSAYGLHLFWPLSLPRAKIRHQPKCSLRACISPPCTIAVL